MNLFKQYQTSSRQLIKCASLVFGIMLIFFSNKLVAQEASDNDNPRKTTISLISRADKDSVVLRWAPGTAGGWVIANQIGYIVEKLEIKSDRSTDYSKYTRLNDLPLKPLELDDWKSKAGENNMFSAVAAQAVYGKLFNPTPVNTGNLNTLKNAADELQNRYSFSLFAADNDAFTAGALGLRFVDKEIQEGKRYAYRVYLAEKTEEYSFDTSYIIVDAKPYNHNPAPKELRYESGDEMIKLFWDDKFVLYSGYYVYRSDDGGDSFKKMNDLPLITVTPTNAYTEAQPGFVDTTANNYTSYVYHIRGVTPFAELSEFAEITAMARDKEAPSVPVMNKPEQISDTEIKLSWKMPDVPKDLKGFIVSRSNNSLHGYHLETIDPLPKNTNEYIAKMEHAYQAYYTVASVDTAGNLAFSVPVLASRIIDTKPAVPVGLVGEINENGVVTLKWNKAKESNIKGYRILMANDPTHEFVQLTGQIHSDTVFSDSINIHTLTRHAYYRIAAVNDRYQHSDLSDILELTRPDVIAPEEAVFADVFVTDSSITLKWHKSSSNDLAMQILMRKEQGESEWYKLDTLMPDISNYIDKKIETNIMYQYTIIGIDESGLMSEPAFPVQARPYDSGIRKEVENFVVEYNPEEKKVNLSWSYTPLEKERTWYLIYKSMNEGEFKEYKSIPGEQFSFTDPKPFVGESSYGIQVMTSRGGESEMATGSITIEENE